MDVIILLFIGGIIVLFAYSRFCNNFYGCIPYLYFNDIKSRRGGMLFEIAIQHLSTRYLVRSLIVAKWCENFRFQGN